MDIDFSAEGGHFSLMGGNLVISSPVKEQHVGNYSCLAANAFGAVISREASVQFGCRWRRREPLPPAAPCRLQRTRLQFIPVNHSETAKAAGGNLRWCEWSAFISALVATATTAPVRLLWRLYTTVVL